MTGIDPADLYRIIGRIEKVLDAVDTKVDGHAETMARHDVRITQLERVAQRTWERVGLWITVLAALAAAVLPQVIQR